MGLFALTSGNSFTHNPKRNDQWLRYDFPNMLLRKINTKMSEYFIYLTGKDPSLVIDSNTAEYFLIAGPRDAGVKGSILRIWRRWSWVSGSVFKLSLNIRLF